MANLKEQHRKTNVSMVRRRKWYLVEGDAGEGEADEDGQEGGDCPEEVAGGVEVEAENEVRVGVHRWNCHTED